MKKRMNHELLGAIMEDIIEELMDILEVSVRRNGSDYPLTLGHLANMLKMAEEKAIEKAIHGYL